jgi:hypothetical protein
VERVAEIQKSTLDIVANQTTGAIDAFKEAYSVPSSAPGAFLFDLIDQGMEKMAKTQKDVIDLMVQQSSQALDITKERRDSASKFSHGVADMLAEATDRTVAAHKILLDFAAEQNRVIAAAVKRQAGISGSAPATAAVETFQSNVDVAIKAQKEIMEASAKPLKAAAGAASSAPKQAA